ncbi:hypothetical protein [uncultured Jannaschia sp.]|uniref:hypothetical protein n=1 Tax=uncultured Jannaschia sp. TaxID=293347 RepID=UPI00260873B3|nr:hypothetical protein [uncultured Jannaschia sp.]
MARDVTVIVTQQQDAGNPLVVGLQLLTDKKTWSRSSGQDDDKVFKPKQGPYRTIGDITELLQTDSSQRVGQLKPLILDTVADGATGQGVSDTSGSAIAWEVKGILEL